MPFSDELVKCDKCGQYTLWWAVRRANGYKLCANCAPNENKKEDKNGSKED